MERRMNSRERNIMMELWATTLMLRVESEAARMLFKRRNPQGYTMYRQALGLLEKATSKAVETIPGEQAHTIHLQMKNSQIKIDTKKQAAELDNDNWVISCDDLAYLINAAMNGMCLTCTDPSKPCPLRRIARESPVEQNNTITMCDLGGD